MKKRGAFLDSGFSGATVYKRAYLALLRFAQISSANAPQNSDTLQNLIYAITGKIKILRRLSIIAVKSFSAGGISKRNLILLGS